MTVAAKIGVNLLWLVPEEVGGSEEATVASLLALAERAEPDLAIRLFLLDGMKDAHPELGDAFPVEVLPMSGRLRAGRIAAESTWLAARTRGLDLVHHAGGTAPPLRGAPYVITLHDLQPLEHRATHSAVKRAYLRAAIPRSVARARTVVVASEYVRSSIMDRFGTDPSKVVVIPHGVEPLAQATPAEVVAERYRIDGPVVMYPAITYPHKNHRVLIAAFAGLLEAYPDALLVLPGSRGSVEDELRAQILKLGISDRVRRTGRISSADIAGLYRTASVVAVPSRYEGFGLPAAEAMAYGAPLVVASTTALPEVVGDAGVIVDPDDVNGWTDAIAALLASPAERGRLVELGRKRAKRFTWAANAEALADVYRRAL